MKYCHTSFIFLSLWLFATSAQAGISIKAQRNAQAGECDGSVTVETSGTAGPFTILLDGQPIAQGVDGSYEIDGLCPGEHIVTVTNAYQCTSELSFTIHDCVPITIENLSAGIAHPSGCGMHDGSVRLSHGVAVVGGDGSYDIALVNSKGEKIPREAYGDWINLGAGPYAFHITDSRGCQGTVEFVLDGDDLEVVAGATHECENSANGAAWAYAYNPANPESFDVEYIYTWSTGQVSTSSEGILLEGLAAGLYQVTVSSAENSCTYVQSIEVQGYYSETPLAISPEVRRSCPQSPTGQIKLNISGGAPNPNQNPLSPPYQISWSDGMHHVADRYSLPSGTYAATITDFCGNSIAQAFEISTFPEIVVSDVVIDHLCPEDELGSIQLNLAGDGPFTTTWYISRVFPGLEVAESQNLENAPAASYRLKVWDIHGCTIEQPFTILQSSYDDIKATSKGSCAELDPGIGSIALSVNTPFPLVSIVWSHQNQTGPSISNLNPGMYQVTVTDAECVYELEYEVIQYTYSNSADGECYSFISCGPEYGHREWTGILSVEVDNEDEGSCSVWAYCGNGERWNPPGSSEVFYVDPRRHSGSYGTLTCVKDKMCEIDWTFTDPFGINYTEYKHPRKIGETIFNPTVKHLSSGQHNNPNCHPVQPVTEWWCGSVLVNTQCYYPIIFQGSNTASPLTRARVYPNPSRAHLDIEVNLETSSLVWITLYDSMGRKLFSEKAFFEEGISIYSIENWQALPAGFYVVDVFDEAGFSHRERLLKY
jgi:hypothetical protein